MRATFLCFTFTLFFFFLAASACQQLVLRINLGAWCQWRPWHRLPLLWLGAGDLAVDTSLASHVATTAGQASVSSGPPCYSQ
ncbi:hypothetical protein F5883DRAFT_558756 [Diaporthe sp. PMI_573]|nr:hypothetical protein F5883DRAFT_558756 [Diaporthaceae sp. PMI_573]